MTTINPLTGREILLGGPTHRKMLKNYPGRSQKGGVSLPPKLKMNTPAIYQTKPKAPPIPPRPSQRVKVPVSDPVSNQVSNDQCEYCNNLFSTDKPLVAYSLKYHNCRQRQSCKTYSAKLKRSQESMGSCQRSAQGIFETVVNNLGIRPWTYLQDTVRKYWTRGLLTAPDYQLCQDLVTEFSNRYYLLIETALLQNFVTDFESGKKTALNTPADWGLAVQLLYEVIDEAKYAVQLILKNRAGDSGKKKAYCKTLKPENCDFPCKVTQSFFGGKNCEYKN